MQRVSNIMPYFRKELGDIFGDREALNWAYLTIDYFLGYNRADCIVHSDKFIKIEISDKLKDIIVWDKKVGQPAIQEQVMNRRTELILVFENKLPL